MDAPSDLPSDAYRYGAVISAIGSAGGTGGQLIFSYSTPRAAFRGVGIGSDGVLVPTKWVEIATTTKPQEYDLPLAAGLRADESAVFSKSQVGRVYVEGGVKCDDGGYFEISQQIFMLPEGYRPAKSCTRNGTIDNGSETRACRIHVDAPTGTVFLWQPINGGPLSGGNSLVFEFSFSTA